MTNQQHPITPPPELVEEWTQMKAAEPEVTRHWIHIATQAARWGADQELEACCEWASQFNYDDYRYQDQLRTARRPKPPSLKERALEALKEVVYMAEDSPPEGISLNQVDIIRHALEQLDD